MSNRPTDFPPEIKVETTHGNPSGPLFYTRDIQRGTPVYVGQELAVYVRKDEGEWAYSLREFEFAFNKCQAEGFAWPEESDRDKEVRLKQAAQYYDPPLDPRDKHLAPCDRCSEHVGIGVVTIAFSSEVKGRICLWCAADVDVAFRGQPKYAEVLRQRGADIAAEFEPKEMGWE